MWTWLFTAVCIYMVTPVIKGQPQGVALSMPEVNWDRLKAPETRCQGQAGTDNGWMHWMSLGAHRRRLGPDVKNVWVRPTCEKNYLRFSSDFISRYQGPNVRFREFPENCLKHGAQVVVFFLHPTPSLLALPSYLWLPVNFRIQFKILTIHGQAPA